MGGSPFIFDQQLCGRALQSSTPTYFVFLGSNVPSVVADVKRRTRLAAWAFGRLKNAIWTNQDITRSLKVRIYRALILPIAIYGAESWTLRQADKRQLDTFEMRCLRVILGVSLMDKIRNEEIRQRLHLPTTICDEVSKRRLKWFGHVVRMPPHRLPFQAYKNDFLKRRPPGRPPARWRDHIERAQLKGTWAFLWEAEHQAQGRPEWRRITRRRAKGHTVLCSYIKSRQVRQVNIQMLLDKKRALGRTSLSAWPSTDPPDFQIIHDVTMYNCVLITQNKVQTGTMYHCNVIMRKLSGLRNTSM